MPRFPIKNKDISGNIATISGDEYKHITRVLRLGAGDKITLFDENSYEYSAEIKLIHTRRLEALIKSKEKVERESNIELNLFQCLPNKPSKFELIIQKGTELGVNNIIPVLSVRTQHKSAYNLSRWEKITLESAKQSSRNRPPIIHEPVKFNKSLDLFKSSELKLIFYEDSMKSLNKFLSKIKNDIKSINIYIGPEGGFSADEIKIASENKYIDVGLGKRILRTETAAISALTLMQFYFGDL